LINGIEAPDDIPEEFIRKNLDIFRTAFLRDPAITPFPLNKEDLDCIEKDLGYLKDTVLPLVNNDRVGKES